MVEGQKSRVSFAPLKTITKKRGESHIYELMAVQIHKQIKSKVKTPYWKITIALYDRTKNQQIEKYGKYIEYSKREQYGWMFVDNLEGYKNLLIDKQLAYDTPAKVTKIHKEIINEHGEVTLSEYMLKAM